MSPRPKLIGDYGRWYARVAFHPKVIAAGNEATGVWARAIAWSLENSDGFFSAGIAEAIAGPRFRKVCGRGVAAGLLEEADGGYRIHDYLDAQDALVDRMARREADRSRKSKGRYPEFRRNSGGTATEFQGNSGGIPAEPPRNSAAQTQTQTQGLTISSSRPEKPTSAAVQASITALVDEWNRRIKGSPGIPAVRQQPREGTDRWRLLKQLASTEGPEPEAVSGAMQAFAADPFNREKGYGIDTFCRHVDRWIDESQHQARTNSPEDVWAQLEVGAPPLAVGGEGVRS